MRRIGRLTACIAIVAGLASCASYSYVTEYPLDGRGKKVEYHVKVSEKTQTTPGSLTDSYSLRGLLDAQRNEILPVEFRRIELIGAEWAAVQRPGDGYRLVKLPGAIFDKTLYSDSRKLKEYLRDSYVSYLVSNERPDGRYDLTIVDARGPRPPITDVCGPSVPAGYDRAAWEAVHIYGACLVIHSTTPGGDAVSRIHRLDGVALTPFIPRLIPMAYRDVNDWGEHVVVSKFDWGLPVGDLGDPELPHSTVFEIVSEHGRPVRLPEGAVGMIPIVSGDKLSHSGWAIVYATPEGRRYAVGLGRPEDVAAHARELPLCDGLRKVRGTVKAGAGSPTMDLFAWKRVGQPSWEIVGTGDFKTVLSAGPGESFRTFESLMARYGTLQAEERARIDAKIVEARRLSAKEAADRRAQNIARLPQFIRAGDQASARGAAIDAKVASAWEAYFKSFGPMEWLDVEEARAAGLTGPLLERAEALMREYDGRIAERRAREQSIKRDGYLPVRDPVAEWDAAFREGLKQRAAVPDQLIQQGRDAYYKNLEKWNRGEQSWY